MTGLPWTYDDGGRAAAGYRGDAGDCVTRAIAIATRLDYQQVYDELTDLVRAHPRVSAQLQARGRSLTARDGVRREVWRPYIEQVLGWRWTPTMGIGTGTTVHLADGEVPGGRLIVRCSKHLVAVIDGIIHDTQDPSRGGTRAVYGWWRAPGVAS